MIPFQGVASGAAAAIQQAAHAAQASHATHTGETGAPPVPFAGMFQSMMAQTSSLEQQANSAITGVMNGSGVELHEAMIATQKADMSFELALQVRNKAVAAYQQMMSMQF